MLKKMQKDNKIYLLGLSIFGIGIIGVFVIYYPVSFGLQICGIVVMISSLFVNLHDKKKTEGKLDG